jgi:hypothetical protein
MSITQPEGVYCICRLRYSACNAHGPYCHLYYVPHYNIFPHISWKARFSGWGGVLLNKTRFFVWNNSHSTKKLAICYKKKCILVVMQCTLNSCQVLMKFELSRRIFEKSNIKFHENPPSGSRVVLCGRMDGQTKLIVTFHNFANAPKSVQRTPNLSCTKCSKSMLTGEVVPLCTAPQEAYLGNFIYFFFFFVSDK